MQTIHKFPLDIDSTQSVLINEGAEILCAQFQYDALCLWALVDTKSPLKPRQIEIFGTGHVITPAPRRYILIEPDFVATPKRHPLENDAELLALIKEHGTVRIQEFETTGSYQPKSHYTELTPEQFEAEYDEQVGRLELALNRKGAKFSVKLANVGNPDYRQDPCRPLPDTTCGWAHVDTLKEAVDLCRLYIAFYELGGGNWSGGLITRNEDGLVIGKVGYNGRVWADERWTPKTKEICVS